ncbi:HAD family hydrolase [Leucothrix sargassi]|nr:HAD family hydrolase [Leucothrix sargassi]
MPTSSLYTTRAVFFDLDGTLLDTAPDMVGALNLLLKEEGISEIDYDTARKVVSDGTKALVNLGFGVDQSEADFTRRCQRYLALYEENVCVDTVLFDGMEETLQFLEQNNIVWGVVTNKPAFLTNPLMKALGLDVRAGSVVSGDSLPVCKPDPEPLFHAANECNVLSTESIYVGDAARDIEAGNRAGMITLLASYGYIDNDQQPDTWGANGIIEQASEIMDWLSEVPALELDMQRPN